MKSLPFLLACLLPLGAAAQSHTVAGRVVSAGDNAPLAGCSVVVKHTSRGTVTGPDGRYEIGAAPGDTLRFSFVGFRTAEEPVGRRTRIDVVLEAAAEAVFEECVVEGSGMEDAAIVATHLLLGAANAGVDSCWVNFFDPDKLAKALGLPENEEIVMLLDLGHAAEGAGPLPNHSSRKPLSETVTFL